MEQWEYRSIPVREIPPGTAYFTAWLNDMGKDGWALASILPVTGSYSDRNFADIRLGPCQILFKRRIVQEE
ncbi:MAG: hypothetical protein UZ21_OP11001000466 [Microgenomates bacterium OLB22]|nr:MAG: hypothetical protein UZ21_OP11001000466 [Microgenomates bacterium OLB22]